MPTKKRVRPPRPREDALESEREYRRKFKSVLVRFTPAEMQVIEGALIEDESAAQFLKAHGLKAAQRAVKR